MKTRRELAQEQLDLMDVIRKKAGINIVTCGHCGTILLHEMKTIGEIVNGELTIDCFGCRTIWNDPVGCPDYWDDGILENSEFDEDKN